MEYTETETCPVCDNHSVVTRRFEGDIIKECEFCGNLEGPSDVLELLELQREAEGLGVSEFSYPLAQFVDSLPGVQLQGDSGGEGKRMPFVAFEIIDHRTYQLENIGQGLRLMRAELQCEWRIEFTFEYELGFEMRPSIIDPKPEDVEAARSDLLLIWRRLQSYTGLAWWKRD